MRLTILQPVFFILKLPPDEPVPSWLPDNGPFFVARTDEELSIVCPSGALPSGASFADAEHGWKCIKVEGVLDFSLTGILSSLAAPLAENGISLFAVSTFNTDYLLVKSGDIGKAKAVLEKAGHEFV